MTVDVEVCPDILVRVGRTAMAQQTEIASDVSTDRTTDPAAIFAAPEVVFHWWLESKRRWEDQNRAKWPGLPPFARVAHETGSDGH
jgi:hypothetical protein